MNAGALSKPRSLKTYLEDNLTFKEFVELKNVLKISKARFTRMLNKNDIDITEILMLFKYLYNNSRISKLLNTPYEFILEYNLKHLTMNEIEIINKWEITNLKSAELSGNVGERPEKSNV